MKEFGSEKWEATPQHIQKCAEGFIRLLKRARRGGVCGSSEAALSMPRKPVPCSAVGRLKLKSGKGWQGEVIRLLYDPCEEKQAFIQDSIWIAEAPKGSTCRLN